MSLDADGKVPLCIRLCLWVPWLRGLSRPCPSMVAVSRGCRALALSLSPRPPGGAAARGQRLRPARAAELLRGKDGKQRPGQPRCSGRASVHPALRPTGRDGALPAALRFGFPVPYSVSDVFCNSRLGRRTLNEIWYREHSIRLFSNFQPECESSEVLCVKAAHLWGFCCSRMTYPHIL